MNNKTASEDQLAIVIGQVVDMRPIVSRDEWRIVIDMPAKSTPSNIKEWMGMNVTVAVLADQSLMRVLGKKTEKEVVKRTGKTIKGRK